MARHNWDLIKKEYVEGIKKDGQLVYPSQAELCIKFTLEKAFLSKKVKADQWDVQKEIYDNKVTTKRQQKKIEVVSDEGSKFDLDCFNVAKVGMSHVLKLLGSGVDDDSISKLATALKNFQTVGKASLGDKAGTTDALTIKVTLVDDEE